MKKNIFFLVSILLIAIPFFVFYFEGQNLRKEHHLTVGKIVEINSGGRGNAGPGIKFMYYANGSIKNGSRRHGNLKYSVHDLENHSFPVVYGNFWFGSFETILITPGDFAYYGYPFPDSLNWVLEYMKK